MRLVLLAGLQRTPVNPQIKMSGKESSRMSVIALS